MTISGDVEFAGARYRLHVDSPPVLALLTDFIAIGNTAFLRAKSGGWCAVGGGGVTNSFGFDPSAVLQTLVKTNGTLVQVGRDIVRGVSTTHYRFTTSDSTPMDLWVDDSDLLRRLVQTHDNETDTADFYDYGASITPITAPPVSNPSWCSPSITATPPTTTP